MKRRANANASKVHLDLPKMAEKSPALREIIGRAESATDVGQKDNREELVRVQLDFPQSKIRLLNELMAETGIGTRKDLFNNALTLLAWAVGERKKGNIVISIDEDTGAQKELVMHPLEHAAQFARRPQSSGSNDNFPPPDQGGDDEDESEE